jgi:site-specific recombinase XerD
MFSYNSNQRDKEEDMKNELNEFLHYLEVEKGFSPGTIIAYRLDLSCSFFPFLFGRRKYAIKDVTKEDIKAYMDYLTVNGKNSVVTRPESWLHKILLQVHDRKLHSDANPAASVSTRRTRKRTYTYRNECIRFLATNWQRSKEPSITDIAILPCSC